MVVSEESPAARQEHRGLSYPANNCATLPTRRYHVPSAVSKFAVVIARSRRVLHVEQVPCPCSETQRLVGIDWEILVGAVQGRFEEHLAGLEETIVGTATGSRQAVEVIEVNVLGQSHDDTGVSSQCASLPAPEKYMCILFRVI